MSALKVVVTGGAGFIGSHIVDALVGRGLDVVVIDNLTVGRKENVHPKAKLVVGDILDGKVLDQALRGAGAVFHNAAKVSVRASASQFVEDAETNVLGTLRVLEALSRHRIAKIVFASSMAVYGPTSGNEHSVESARAEPMSPYGVGKLAAEMYSQNLAALHGFQAVCLRYFNTYGPRQKVSPYVGVITSFIDTLRKNGTPTIHGDGKQVRDFIHVRDVARANLAALDYAGASDVFNVGTGVGTSVNDLATLLARKLGKPAKFTHGPEQPGETRNSIADTEKARRVLGFEATEKLDAGLGELVGG